MNTLITLFPIASLLIIAMWFFYDTKPYHKFKAWTLKASRKIWEFFTNICERVNSEIELF